MAGVFSTEYLIHPKAKLLHEIGLPLYRWRGNRKTNK